VDGTHTSQGGRGSAGLNNPNLRCNERQNGHEHMTHINRRSFLATAIVAAAHARTLKTIGVQLYTVRSILPEKPLETLKALEQIGYREAEVVQAGIDKIWAALKQTSLKPVSLHMDTALFTRNQDKLPAAL